MLLKWFNAREATEVGTVLADDFVLLSSSGSSGTRRQETRSGPQGPDLQKLLQRVDREPVPEAKHLQEGNTRELLQVALAREGR